MRLATGNLGSDVGRLHQLLLERGLDLAAEELRLRVFGRSTKAAVQIFQAQNVDQTGAALEVDGIVGPKTWLALNRAERPSGWTAPGWYCKVALAPESVRPVIAAALSDLGRHEQPDGSNGGPQIEKFLPGLRSAPWCAYAVSTWLESAPGGSPFPYRFGAVVSIADWGKSHHALVYEPRPGDVWCALRGDGHGHAELVVHVYPDGRMALIGGNVRNAVRGTVREASSATALVRPISG